MKDLSRHPPANSVWDWLAPLILLVALLCSCASTYRPATGSGKATVYVSELRRFHGTKMETRRLVIVNNPSDEEILLDCNALRIRVPAHKAADVLLMPYDRGCDAMNDVTYESTPIPDVMQINGTLKAAPK